MDATKWGLAAGAALVAVGALYVAFAKYTKTQATPQSQPQEKPNISPEEAIEVAKKNHTRNWRSSLARTLARATETLPVAVDIPRLVTHITVIDRVAGDAEETGMTFSGPYSVLALVSALDAALNQPPTPNIKATYRECVLCCLD